MGALPKRRISTGRKGRRRQDKTVQLKGRGVAVTSRQRREKKKDLRSASSDTK
ncbi:hypothetical protein LRY65_00080 [Candidatus Woesebacteria bacterium]|nr:hypothetical protein [Candidatus Woesebacteria bacterium]MCD8507261.1 hypothetical protein [Candidatus Woesebacteria bacterium]MCD8526604.1 hypothetical protein [Candidatus Woesebacteria bacterium]MCD8545999.1 hypothetical protein [Candidatus Woesebacteria bacterium]